MQIRSRPCLCTKVKQRSAAANATRLECDKFTSEAARAREKKERARAAKPYSAVPVWISYIHRASEEAFKSGKCERLRHI